MAIEYNNIILNVGRKPSKKSFLVAIPMFRYRIETNEFSYGLNFFQKAVLKFKVRPGTKDATIANYLGLDERLITIIIAELQRQGLINEHGALSDKGKEKLWEIDGLVVDSNKRKIGYVLKYVTQDKLYQYYVDKLVMPNLSDGIPPKIVTGTKGDGFDYTETPFFLNELFYNKKTVSSPDEKEILEIIKNSSKKPNSSDDNQTAEKLQKQLSVRFIPDERPEIVWICTWIYLQEREDNTFEPDWRVLDPFGFEDNVAMKAYLNTQESKKLLESINNHFADAETIGRKKISDYQEQLNKVVEDKLLSDFLPGVSELDKNLQQYIQEILKDYCLWQTVEISNIGDYFFLNIQKALENILKKDQERRSEAYKEMYNLFEPDNTKNIEQKKMAIKEN
jgi:hypothetical protein